MTETAAIDAHVGERLKKRRLELEMSQGDVGEGLGLSNKQIQKYEAGLSALSFNKMYILAKLLDVSVEYFYKDLRKTARTPANDDTLCVVRDTPINILLVEDDDFDEDTTRAALDKSECAYNLYTVHNGVEAIKFLKNRKKDSLNSPEIVLLDLNIPKKHGLEVLKEIREDDSLKYIPVIILTNSIDKKDMTEAYELGVSGFLSKSFNYDEFCRNISLTIKYWTLANVLPSMQS